MNSIIDGHLHVYSKDTQKFPWANPKAAAPPEPTTTADYLGIADRTGITKAVLLQPSAYALDSSYIRSVAEEHPDRFKFMVIAEYRDEDSHKVFEKECSHQLMCGARLNLIADDRSLDVLREDPFLLRAIGSLAGKEKIIDLHVRMDQFGLVETFAEKFPTARFIVDHLGYPNPADKVPDSYAAAVEKSTALKNVFFKLSGYEMKSKLGFPFEDMTAYARYILGKAGSKRCLWGSNYPFVNLAASVEQVLSLVDELCGGSEDKKKDVLYSTADSLFWRGPK